MSTVDSTTPAANPWARALKRLIRQPEFLVAVVVLGVAAAGLNAATEFMQLHFKKKAVPLAVKLDDPAGIPAEMGAWVQVSKDAAIDPEVEHVLGTREYVFRDYVDSRIVSRAEIDQLKGLSPAERGAKLVELESQRPEALIRAGITYYTGLVDTVAHIPDRCMIADGYEVSTYQTKNDRKLGVLANGKERNVSFRYIAFDDQTGQGRVSRKVAYLFHVNGHYESDPLGVRRSLQNLAERYGYYAKVELMTVSPAQMFRAASKSADDPSLRAMEDFLTSALPEVEHCLPDWEHVHDTPAK